MHNVICSAPWLVRCTSWVLRVLPMMTNPLAYRELLLLYLVDLAVFGWSQTLHRYVCELLGGDGVLIVGFDSDLLLLAVLISPEIGSESFHLHCIVLI